MWVGVPGDDSCGLVCRGVICGLVCQVDSCGLVCRIDSCGLQCQGDSCGLVCQGVTAVGWCARGCPTVVGQKLVVVVADASWAGF